MFLGGIYKIFNSKSSDSLEFIKKKAINLLDYLAELERLQLKK